MGVPLSFWMRVILMGLRGSGKTTVGRLLAQRLGVTFLDLDDVTPRLLGHATAGEALRSKGEPAFRDAEARAIREMLGSVSAACVLALGGGSPTAPGVVEVLRGEVACQRGRIIYLHASPAVLRARLSKDADVDRPSLTGQGVLDEIGEVYTKRDGLYRSIASVVVDVEGKGIAALCDDVERVVGSEPRA